MIMIILIRSVKRNEVAQERMSRVLVFFLCKSSFMYACQLKRMQKIVTR